MSHLAHIVALKQALISNGVTNPVAQIEIVRTCYVKALISVHQQNPMPEQKCWDYTRYILSYWNETTPVEGNKVISEIGNFLRALENALNGTIVDNKLKLVITPVPEGVEFDFTKLEQYASVINTLKAEAIKKLSQFEGKEQLI